MNNHIPFFIRRRCLTGIVVSVLVFVVCGMFLCTKSHAESAGDRVDDVISYESVLVCQGNTLWSIARDHLDQPTNAEIQAYVQEIISLNNLSSCQIHSGNYILVPTYTSRM